MTLKTKKNNWLGRLKGPEVAAIRWGLIQVLTKYHQGSFSLFPGSVFQGVSFILKSHMVAYRSSRLLPGFSFWCRRGVSYQTIQEKKSFSWQFLWKRESLTSWKSIANVFLSPPLCWLCFVTIIKSIPMDKRRTYIHWLRAMRAILELVWDQSQSDLTAEEMECRLSREIWGTVSREKRKRWVWEGKWQVYRNALSCCHCLDWKTEKGRKFPKVFEAVLWPPTAQRPDRPQAMTRTLCDLPLQPPFEAFPHMLSAPASWTLSVSWLCQSPACCQPSPYLFPLSPLSTSLTPAHVSPQDRVLKASQPRVLSSPCPIPLHVPPPRWAHLFVLSSKC